MSKFKVGDKVTLKEDVFTSYWEHGKEYIVTSVYEDAGWERIKTNIDDTGDTTNGWLADKFELIHPSPIRTTTRKEIVAGEYGTVLVYYVNGDLRIELNTSKHTPQQLREAANTLIQIAEALEFNEQ